MMTAEQYYFPYFFSLDKFNVEMESFGLHASIAIDKYTQMPDELLIHRADQLNPLLTISFGNCLMIDNGTLYFWETDTNLVNIKQVCLNELTEEPWVLDTKIDLTILKKEKNDFTAHLDVDHFVTFTKKDKLGYRPSEDEKFVIIIISKTNVHVIPFYEFNQASSEREYQWPVIAQLDIINKKIYSRGMRMKDFEIDLGWAL